jgi:tetratricopeptide (TPR) repeat protein
MLERTRKTLLRAGYWKLNSRYWGAIFFIITLAGLAFGQTFELDQQKATSSPKVSQGQKNQGQKNQGQEHQDQSNKDQRRTGDSLTPSLGWGSSIEVARQARAAEDALKRGDYNSAVTFAEQAAKAAPQNADLWFLFGYAARMAGHYPVSVDAYKRGLQGRPNSAQGLGGLAQTYAKMGRNEEARQLFLKLAEANPRDAGALQLAGELSMNSDPQLALDLLRRAAALQPSPRTDLLLARAYQRIGRPEEARQLLARAKNRAPSDPDILRAIAGEYRDSGQYDQAILTLKSLPAKTSDVLAELAYTYDLAGKKQEAANLYSQVAKSSKGNLGFQLSAAQTLFNLGEGDTARGFLERAQQLDANYYRLHAIKAQMAASESRLADAITEYQAALKNLPNAVAEGPLFPIQVRLNLYELYQQTGNDAEAKHQLGLAADEIQRAQVPDASKAEFLRMRAAIESTAGNLEAADKDLKEALSLAPSNVNSLLNYGTLLWKFGQKDTARKMFLKALELDKHNRQAWTSLGYLAREVGDAKSAEDYFSRVVRLFPKDYVAFLALGDLYSSERNFRAAQTNYEAAYQRVQNNGLIVAGGANAALEAHNLDLAKQWLDRATGTMNDNPQVMRERQRYLTWTGGYQEASELGYKVIERLPRDPQAPVYLAYDLYYLGRYADAFALATKYDSILPNNRDLALIEGYVHARDGFYQEALEDFTRAVERDPKMATGYANRGFMRNNLRQAKQAVQDFQRAIKIRPDYGEAHFGLAYSYLQLHHPQPALEQLSIAQKSLGTTRAWHLARAEAFRQEQRLPFAEKEYRIALDEVPNDLTTQLALADTLYQMHRYQDCIDSLNAAVKLAPENPAIYAQLAQANAKLGQREATLHNIQLAEQYAKGQVDVLMATGDAFLALGDREAAMQRFSHALEDPKANRLSIRLAIGEIFVRKGQWDDARRQIGLGFAEARMSEPPQVTSTDFVAAANIFLATQDFDLAKTYFEKARLSGANPRLVAIGLANTYLAEGDSHQAAVSLGRLGNPNDLKDDYDYIMARANLFRQRQDTVSALSAFTRASMLAGPDGQQAGERTELDLAGEEGRQINQKVSLYSTASFEPTLEDINVYTLDAKMVPGVTPSSLPPPRHSFQSLGEAHYRLHLNNLPTIEGFVGESMTSGKFSFPSNDVIQDRNTYDTMINGGISPVLHLGSNSVRINTGLQFTIRRDTLSPVDMNQNLFRQYLYLSTSSFFNWVSVQGSAIREAGPFTEQNLHSRDALANLEFTVGRPWGKTSLLTGYAVRDLLIRPAIREYYSTSTYVGVQRKFGSHLTAAVLGEYLRSWRVLNETFAIAQAMRPGARFEYRPSNRWQVTGSFTLSRGEGFHAYDNAQSEFMVSYLRPVRRSLDDGGGAVPVAYPARFSFGVVQQTFYNFGGQSKTTLLPVIRLNLF